MHSIYHDLKFYFRCIISYFWKLLLKIIPKAAFSSKRINLHITLNLQANLWATNLQNYCFVKPTLSRPVSQQIPRSLRIIHNCEVGNLGPDTDFSTWGQPYPNCNHLTNGDYQRVQKMAIQFKAETYGLFPCQ